MLKGLLDNPEFMLGASILGSRGNVGQGLLGYSQMQNAMVQNQLAQAKLNAFKQQQEQQAKQRIAFGNPGGQVLDGPPDPGMMAAPVTQGTGIFSSDPNQQQNAMLNVARESTDPGLALQKIQQVQAQMRQRDYGKSPQWVRDRKTGETLPVQFSNMGEAVIPGQGKVDPSRYEYLRPMTFQDMGGQVVPFNYGSATPAGSFQKTLDPSQLPSVKRAQASATASGTITGKRHTEAVLDLPTIEGNANQAIAHIDAMMSHPGLDYAVGASSMLPVVPGTPAADYMTRLEQLQGGVFLEAYKSLKGGGQITEVEGKKAEQALARLARAQSEPEHRAALKEYRDIIYRGLLRARKAAEAGGVRMNDATPEKLEGWSIKEK